MNGLILLSYHASSAELTMSIYWLNTELFIFQICFPIIDCLSVNCVDLRNDDVEILSQMEKNDDSSSGDAFEDALESESLDAEMVESQEVGIRDLTCPILFCLSA